MTQICQNCGFHVSDKAKYCRKCGSPVGVTNVSDLSSEKILTQYNKFWESSKNRMGLKGIKSILMDMRKGFRRTVYLLPVFIVTTIWLIVSLLISAQAKSPVLNFLAFLTFGEGAMSGGFLGLVGGIIGKMIFTYFIITILTPLYSLQRPFKGIKIGTKLFLSHVSHFGNLKEVYIFILTMGLSFISYNMLTGNNNWIKSIIAPIIIVIFFRAMGRKAGITWDVFHRVFGKTMSKDITFKSLGGFVAGMILAVPSFLFGSAFICYYVGISLLLVSALLKLIAYFMSKKEVFRRLIPLILIAIILFTPIKVLAAPYVNEIRGNWILQDIKLVNPDTKVNRKDHTDVKDGSIKKYYAVDTNYTIEYFWNPPPQKIRAGDETSIMMNQSIIYTSDEDSTQSAYLRSLMYITYNIGTDEPEQIEYFKESRDFTSENMHIEYSKEYTAYFLHIANYYDLYGKLNKNNCRLTISVQASFGGRVEYVYRLQRTPTDGFFTWFVGDGSKNDHAKPWGTLFINLASISAALLCSWVAVGALTLKRRKPNTQTTQKEKMFKQAIPQQTYSEIYTEPSFSDSLVSLHEQLSNAAEAGWPKYKESLMKILLKSKEHTAQAKNALAIMASISKYKNSLSGIISNLAALGYNNDSYGIEVRGEDITNASGKIIYSNYVFNSLASKTSYTAFMELANAFALQDMKVGVIVSPSVNLRGIMSIGPDSIIDAKAAYKNALNGRYGDRIKNLAKKDIITLEAVEAFSQDNRNAEDLDNLYESIITDTLSEKDYNEMSLYKVYSTKRAVKLAQAQNFRYENTSLVVPSLFDW